MKIPNWLLNLLLPKEVKKMLEGIREAIKGKKTYLAALGLLIAGIIKYAEDGNLQDLIKVIFEALALAGLRAAI